MKLQSSIWDKIYASMLEWHYETKIPDGIKLKGKRVLEIGVGTGKTLKALIGKRAKEIIAIDNSKEAIKRAKKINQKVKVMNADAKNMPFDDKSFDVIVCYYMLNNMLAEDRVEAVEEIIRVLSDKGVILFEDFAVGDLREKGKLIENNTIQRKDGLICHFFTKEEVENMFEGLNIKLKTKEFKPFRVLKDKRKIISAVIRR